MEAKAWDKAELQVFNKPILQCVYFVHNILHVCDFLSGDRHLIPGVYGSYKYNMK